MSEQELAQKILSWIERTQQENMQDDVSLQQVADRYHVLVEDIEKVCKETLAEVSKPINLHIISAGDGPEMVIYPAQTKDLWQIAKEVAETDSLCDGMEDIHGVPIDHFCPFCGQEQPHRDRVMNVDFPHAATCIVTKARQLIEWRNKLHAEK